MASACINDVTLSPPSYTCYSPRISFSHDTSLTRSDPIAKAQDSHNSDPFNFIDFEFHLNDSVAMLPADQLFANGKVVPLQFEDPSITNESKKPVMKEKVMVSGAESFSVSPKAPTYASRWRELLRLKRLQQQTNSKSNSGTKNLNLKSIKHVLNRKPASSDQNVTLPLLKDAEWTEPEPKPKSETEQQVKPNRDARNQQKVRVVARARRPTERCVSADSPRMNASGKVVFQGLGRSVSSPSTFNGGTRVKFRGVERSLSANVRVTNVPVYKIGVGSRGLGLFLRNGNSKCKI